MDPSGSNELRIHDLNNDLKEIEACLEDEQVLKWSFVEAYKGREEIKALLEEIKVYTAEKCELEQDIMLNECKIKQTQNLDKILDDDKQNHSELQILYKQEEKKKFELVEKYKLMMEGKSQRLRDSHKYYNKENCVKELAMMTEEFEEWSNKEKQAQKVVDELQRQSDEIRPSVPYDVFNSIMGKETKGKKLKGNNPKNKKTSKK